ncbi:MAG: efflux transporter outer membrane subunit [Deltaproteobacteria bacterium]|nr:efflux transporter outer membrane subunit [Deltaproteobacteria bacterium]MCL4873440.1 efflux transporter outer membrane subunit [bacterium]
MKAEARRPWRAVLNSGFLPRLKLIGSAALTALFLSSCAVGPDYVKPEPLVEDKWFSEEVGGAGTREAATDWWTVLGDPQLEKYINAAAAQNRELEAARAAVLRARSLRRESAAPFYPTLGANAAAVRQRSGGETSSAFSGTIDSSWELDVFGGTRRATEAAGARVDGAEENRRAVLLSVLAETARNYYAVRGFQKRIAITQKNIGLQERTYKLVDTLFQLGEASAFDLSRARGQLELTQSRLPDLEAEMRAGIFRLSVLLGQPPEALLGEMSAVKPLPAPPDVVPVGLRSDILRRRPDVRAAERELAASTADIGAATARLYPDFSLTGVVGGSARVLSDLFQSGSTIFSIGSFLRWPIFEGGALRARIDAEGAEADRAEALYEQSVLDALADAETALTRYARKLDTRNRLQNAVESRQRSVELARALFDSGEEDFLSVLDAERELVNAEDELVRSETDAILNLITLYTALGGGWEAFEEAGGEAEE